MKKSTKVFFITMLKQGGVFALLTFVFNYFMEADHLLISFLINFVFFGTFMGFMAVRKYKKDNYEGWLE